MITQECDVDPGRKQGAHDVFRLGKPVQHVRVMVQVRVIPAPFPWSRCLGYVGFQSVRLAGLDRHVDQLWQRGKSASSRHFEHVVSGRD